jgi:hypothetical protein
MKMLVIAMLMGVSSIAYSAEEIPDGEKPTNKRNINTVNFNSNENTQLTKEQKLQYTPLGMNEYLSNDIYFLIFHLLTTEPLEKVHRTRTGSNPWDVEKIFQLCLSKRSFKWTHILFIM